MNKAFGFYFLIVLSLLASCTGRHSVEVKSLNFTDQIDQLQNLEFGFSREMVPDSMIEIWDSTDYIQFEPQVKGKFRWSDKKTLIFSPGGSFAPNTDYKATFNDKVTNLLNNSLNLKDGVFSFHTPYLEMQSGYAFWSRNEVSSNQIELHIKTLFNYPVDAAEAAKFINLKINGKIENITIQTSGTSGEIEIASAYIPGSNDVKSLEIVMLQGMRAVGSDRRTTEPLSLQVNVPPVNTLEIIDITTSFEAETGIISVYMSQPVVENGINQQIAIEPTIDYQISMISNGFVIKGSFADNKSYRLTLKKSLTGIFGPSLTEDQVKEVTFGSLRPYVAFADKSGMYLSPKSAGNLGLNLINIPKIKVTVFRIFENNIQHFIRNGQSWDWYGDEEGYYENLSYQLNEDYGKVISTKEYITSNLPKNGNLRLLNIKTEDLYGVNPEMKGIYLIKAESTDKAWLNDVQLLSFSDIGLIVHQGADEIFVAARSIATAEPLEGVTINFHSRNNQLIHREVTGDNGIAVFRNVAEKAPSFEVSMISARKSEDFNVLLFSRSAVELSRFETGGKRTKNLDYDVFIYGDRNLYRPGDSVFCNAILRDFNFKTVTGFPIIFRVIAPNGKDFLKKRININSNGSAMLSFVLPAKAYTGTYTVEVLTVSNVLEGSYRIKVEEFMPDRISVTAKADKQIYFPGEKVKLTVTAMNLSGPPAGNRKVENEMRLTRKNFQSKDFMDYDFNLTTKENIDIISNLSQTTTAANGIATEEFQLPEAANIGLLQGSIYTTVFDETGRPVNRGASFNLFTQNTFLGIKPLPFWLSTGRPIDIRMIAVKNNGKAISSYGKIEIVMVEWETVLERNYGQTTYRSQRREVVILSKTVNISANGYSVKWTPNVTGEYVVRLSIPNSNMWVERSFYAYRYGDSDESAFKVSKDGQVEITFDKTVYKPGDEAKILFKTPFAGELIITVEQDKVIDNYSIKADNNGASLKLKVKDEYLPNIWITATLLRKTSEIGIPLTVAHGFASMTVEKPTNRIITSITAPKQIRSSVKQTVTVKTTPGAEVTLAVVDEGILQITDYKSPDPYAYFYGKRALEVTPYDLFDELLPELTSKRSSPGGDQAFDLGKRLNPMTAKRVKLLSLWSGRMKADGNGVARFNAHIPQFSGSVRIMAVAYKDHQFGSAEHSMKVSDPVNIISSLPRFLSPNDHADVAVTLMNTTNKPITANLSIKTKGINSSKLPFTASSPSPSKITIPANSEKRISYNLIAQNQTGNGEITFIASTQGETFTEKTEIAVRPAVPLVKEASTGVINANTTTSVKTLSNFIKGSGTTKLLITKNPAGQLANHLEELVNYPYGCTEQSISAVFPQLYFKDLSNLLKKGHIPGSEFSGQFINEGIRKIASVQQYNGGLVMWPTHGEISTWVTAYAAHFLYEAERAGYSIDKQVVDGIHKYLLEYVKTRKYSNYYYYDNQSKKWITVTEPEKEIFYSLFVLALNGKHHLPTMNYFKSRINDLSTDSRFLLAAAYKLTGDTKSYEAVVPKNQESNSIETMTGRSFNSPIRDHALSLYTLVMVDDNNPLIPLIAKQLGEMISNRNWLTTQERVFSLLALGKMSAANNSANITGTISSNNKTFEFKGNDINITLPANEANIKTHGTGKLYWFLQSEGLPINNQVKEEDRILKVRRQIYDRHGRLITANTFNQNDLLVIKVSVSTTDNSIIDNVVVTDILPACFEIENTRLTADREMEWIKNRGEPEYMDIRDDRVNFFTKASGQPIDFYYMVRVVGRGSFIHGPAGAEAMYNGQYYSYSGYRKITSL